MIWEKPLRKIRGGFFAYWLHGLPEIGELGNFCTENVLGREKGK